MEKFCAITATRGDRPIFLKHNKVMMKRQTIPPAAHFIIDDAPVNDEIDISDRIKSGIYYAMQAGYDIVYIIEDDDYYPPDYFENMQLPKGCDILGIPRTILYHIFDRRYREIIHPERASLFCTAFRISSLSGFAWPNKIFLDLDLWEYAIKNLNYLFTTPGNLPVGIKHNIGKCASSCHRLSADLFNTDHDLSFLKSKVDNYSFNFYKSLDYAHTND